MPGSCAAGTVVGTQEQRLTWKLSDVPLHMATALTSWLGQQSSGYWCYSAPGAQASVVNMLLSGSPQLLPALRAVQQQTTHCTLSPGTLNRPWSCQRQPRRCLFPLPPGAGRRVAVMGILNVTPDSFSDGGLYFQPEQAMKHAETMLAEGAE